MSVRSMNKGNELREETMRDFTDEEGVGWRAIAVDAIVAHGKPVAMLAFAPAERADAEPSPANVNFNSREAAAVARRTMSEKERRRRRTLAKATVVGV